MGESPSQDLGALNNNSTDSEDSGDEPQSLGCLALVKNNKLSRRFPINNNPFIIGSKSGTDLVIKNNEDIGLEHVKFFKKGDNVICTPVSERNYVSINGKKIVKNTVLAVTDTIQIGPQKNNKTFVFLESEDQEYEIPSPSKEPKKADQKKRKRTEEASPKEPTKKFTLLDALLEDFENNYKDL
jgi:hypothetical protein